MAEPPARGSVTPVKAPGSIILSFLALTGPLGTGCATVDPTPDYQRAADDIQERTGTSGIYSPVADPAVDDRVAALLGDGLTDDEAVEIALLNNPGFQSLFEEIGISRAQVVQSGLLSNPLISAVVKFPEAGGRVSLDLGMSQEIADLWQIPVRRRIAKAKLEQTLAAVVQQAVDLGAEARTSYYRLRVRQLEVENVADNLRIVEESTRIVEQQTSRGAASELDLNLARAALLDVRMELISAERLRESARIDLGRTLGLAPADYPARLTSDLPASEPIAGLEDLAAYAREERYDLRRAEQELAAAEDEIIRQSLLVFPSVMAGWTIERPERQSPPGRNIAADTLRSSIRNGAPTAPDIQSRAQRSAEKRQFIDFLIGPTFQATIPLFDQNQAQIAIAASRVRQRRKDLEALLVRADSEIAQGLNNLNAATKLVAFYQREAIPLAESNERASRVVFSTGAQSVLVLLEAQRSLLARSRASIAARGEYAVAHAELERAVGGRLPSNFSTSRPTEVMP